MNCIRWVRLRCGEGVLCEAPTKASVAAPMASLRWMRKRAAAAMGGGSGAARRGGAGDVSLAIFGPQWSQVTTSGISLSPFVT